MIVVMQILQPDVFLSWRNVTNVFKQIFNSDEKLLFLCFEAILIHTLKVLQSSINSFATRHSYLKTTKFQQLRNTQLCGVFLKSFNTILGILGHSLQSNDWHTIVLLRQFSLLICTSSASLTFYLSFKILNFQPSAFFSINLLSTRRNNSAEYCLHGPISGYLSQP